MSLQSFRHVMASLCSYSQQKKNLKPHSGVSHQGSVKDGATEETLNLAAMTPRWQEIHIVHILTAGQAGFFTKVLHVPERYITGQLQLLVEHIVSLARTLVTRRNSWFC